MDIWPEIELETDPAKLGAQLRKLRKERSGKQLVSMTERFSNDIKVWQLSNVERGLASPTMEILQIYAIVCKTPLAVKLSCLPNKSLLSTH